MTLAFRYWFEANDTTPPVIDWQSDIDTYLRGLEAINSTDYRGFVSLHPADYYREQGRNRRVFHEPLGQVGFSLLPHWKETEGGLFVPDPEKRHEIAGLYNIGGKRTEGWGKFALRHGAKLGGNYLEAFGIDPTKPRPPLSLPVYYHKHLGAQPVGYMPFADEYAPEGWNYERWGRPPLIQMRVPDVAYQDLDDWFKVPHDKQSMEEWRERIRELERQHGAKRSQLENNMPSPKKPEQPFGKSLADLTPEEYDQLAQGVDDFFTGLAPALTPEQVEERRKALDEEKKK
jgi:hypothetical protein